MRRKVLACSTNRGLLLFLPLLLTSKCLAILRDPSDVRLPTTPREPRQLWWPWSSSSVHVDVTIPDSPDGHLVTSLPLLDPISFTTEHWAGHLPASADMDKYFFYWLFAPDLTSSSRKIDEVPLLIWLNGGPGCSSMDGLFMENGPFRFELNEDTQEYRLTPDAHSWHKLPAYTLYIDQPVGTGLSFTTSKNYAKNDTELSEDFYYFFQQFLTLHDDKFVSRSLENIDLKVLNRPLFFSGESYAGHYNTIFVNHILKQNTLRKIDQLGVVVRVSGAAIGNGFFDPYHQYGAGDFAYGRGLIGLSELMALRETEIQCQRYLDAGIYNTKICFKMIKAVVNQGMGEDSEFVLSKYDIRRIEERRGSRSFPPGHDLVETFLGDWPIKSAGVLPEKVSAKVLDALHADAAAKAGRRFEECSDPPHDALRPVEGKGVVPDLVEVLEHPDEVQLLFFNGVFDVICNHVGNEKALDLLPWKYRDQWLVAQRYAWIAESDRSAGLVSGYMREHQNLKFLKVRDSGHMVPFDVPQVATDMMRVFIYRNSFNTSPQDITRDRPKQCSSCPTCSIPLPTASNAGGYVVTFSWLVAGLVVVSLPCFTFWFRRRKRRRSVGRAITMLDGLEMLSSSSYQD